MFFSYRVTQNWIQVSRFGLTRAGDRRIITSKDLLTMLLYDRPDDLGLLTGQGALLTHA